MAKQTHRMKAKVVLWPGSTAAWHFLYLPREKSAEITKRFGAKKRGWGSLPVEVTLGKTKWKTSIFPDKRENTFILPLKLAVRRAEGIGEGDVVTVFIKFLG